MLIRIGYDIQFDILAEAPIIGLLNVHPSREKDLIEPDVVRVEPDKQVETFVDPFGNKSVRVFGKKGKIRFHNSTLIRDSGLPDEQGFDAEEIPVQKLPPEVLPYLMRAVI